MLDAVHRHPLLFAYLAALIPAVVMAVTQPLWSQVDEAEHVDFIVQLSHGVYPVADKTLTSSEVVALMKEAGVYTYGTPGSYPAPDLTDISSPPAGMSDRANAAWMSRHLWQLSYESAQTPGFYIAMVPVWRVADPLLGTRRAVYVLRVIQALILAAMAPLAVFIAGRLAPGGSTVRALAAVFAILLPGLALNGTRVSNDTPAAVLGAAAVAMAVGWAGETWTWRRTVALGCLFGSALLTKVTVLGLLPALLLATMLGRGLWTRRALHPIGVVAIACVMLVPWLVINAHLYGTLIPSQRIARVVDSSPFPLTPLFAVFDVSWFVITYWSGEPLDVFPMSEALVALGTLLSLFAVVGLIGWLVRKRLPATRPTAVAVTALIGMVGFILVLPLTHAFQASPGRLVYAVVPSAAALIAFGLGGVLPAAAPRVALGSMYGVLAAVNLVGLAAEPPPLQHPGPGMPPPSAAIEPSLAYGTVDGVEITVDKLAWDSAARATWIHVTASNTGPQEAEWSADAIVTVGANRTLTDYLKSAQLPGDIDPGQTVSGWMFVPLGPDIVHAVGSMEIRFPAVAANDYRDVSDIAIQIAT